jgi:hypothetical protein
VMLVSVSASHGSLSSPPSRNLRNVMPVPVAQCTVVSTCGEETVRCTVSALCEQLFKSPPQLLTVGLTFPQLPPSKVISSAFSSSELESISNRLTLFLARVISSTLKMAATLSSETSVYSKVTWCHIPEDGILHICIYVWAYSWPSRPETLLLLLSSSSVVLTRLSGPRSRPTTSRKIW